MTYLPQNFAAGHWMFYRGEHSPPRRGYIPADVFDALRGYVDDGDCSKAKRYLTCEDAARAAKRASDVAGEVLA